MRRPSNWHEVVCAEYEHGSTYEIALKLGVSQESVRQYAKKLGIKKSKEARSASISKANRELLIRSELNKKGTSKITVGNVTRHVCR
jgi:predicted transcriptional regulator